MFTPNFQLGYTIYHDCEEIEFVHDINFGPYRPGLLHSMLAICVHLSSLGELLIVTFIDFHCRGTFFSTLVGRLCHTSMTVVHLTRGRFSH